MASFYDCHADWLHCSNQHGVACMRAIRQILADMEYRFDQYDPQAFEGFVLQFEEISDNVLVAKNIPIEGQLIRVQRSQGVTVSKVALLFIPLFNVLFSSFVSINWYNIIIEFSRL